MRSLSIYEKVLWAPCAYPHNPDIKRYREVVSYSVIRGVKAWNSQRQNTIVMHIRIVKRGDAFLYLSSIFRIRGSFSFFSRVAKLLKVHSNQTARISEFTLNFATTSCMRKPQEPGQKREGNKYINTMVKVSYQRTCVFLRFSLKYIQFILEWERPWQNADHSKKRGVKTKCQSEPWSA